MHYLLYAKLRINTMLFSSRIAKINAKFLLHRLNISSVWIKFFRLRNLDQVNNLGLLPSCNLIVNLLQQN